MKLINNTASKVSIRKPGVVISLLPGEEASITEEQRRIIQPYISGFSLTIERDELKKPLPKEVEEEDLTGGITVDPTGQKYSEKVLKGMTAAQLRELCKKEGLLVSGTRPQLIEKLVGTSDDS